MRTTLTIDEDVLQAAKRLADKEHSSLGKTLSRLARQGKHIVMTDGTRIVTIPRGNPVNAYTMGGIVRDAGLSVEEFKKLL